MVGVGVRVVVSLRGALTRMESSARRSWVSEIRVSSWVMEALRD